MSPSEDEQPKDVPARSAEAWLTAVRDAERRGELLSAFDLAERGLEEHPGEMALRYHAVLALARTGSTDQAARRFVRARSGTRSTPKTSPRSQARIGKDVALAASGEAQRRLAGQAAMAYRVIRDRTHGYFPAINAATLDHGGR